MPQSTAFAASIGLAKQHRLGRPGAADETRQEHRAACLGGQADVDEHESQVQILGHVDQVAVEQHRCADADRLALHGRHQRFGQHRQHVEQARRGGRTVRWRNEVANVVDSTEVATLRREHRCAKRIIFFEGLEALDNHGVHRVGDGVALGRAVQPDLDDRSVPLDLDISHAPVSPGFIPPPTGPRSWPTWLAGATGWPVSRAPSGPPTTRGPEGAPTALR